MKTATINYKLIKNIKDEKFDVDQLHQYILLLNVGVRDLQVAVVDSQSSQCLLLEDFVFGIINSYAELQQLLAELFNDHHFLTAGFWKEVRVSIKNHKFIQVPNALFIEEAASDYLKFNANIDLETEDVLSFQGNQTEAVTVFAVPKNIRQWLIETYPNTKLSILHQSNALIEFSLTYHEKQYNQPIFIYVDRFKLHIMIVRNKQLMYYNQFSIKQFSDYVKYIMLVMNGLKFDHRKSDVVLWGYIGKNSLHFSEFQKFIKNVIFGERAKFLSFRYMFDETQEHHFMDLYGMYLCNPQVAAQN